MNNTTKDLQKRADALEKYSELLEELADSFKKKIKLEDKMIELLEDYIRVLSY